MSGGAKKGVTSFLAGTQTSVDILAIEKELRKLWQEATNRNSGTDHGDIVRACAFNLILLMPEAGVEQESADTIDQILTHHPGRAIIGIYVHGDEPKLDAWVSARCHLQGKAKRVCSEQITVRSEGQPPEALSSVVAPLMIPDLPSFMWWRADTIDASLIKRMLAPVDRLIVDSGRKPYDAQYLCKLASIVNEEGSVFMSDLNWRRIDTWFVSLGNAFDGFPLPMDYMFRFKSVKITYASASDHPQLSCQALLLLSWLSSRLGWRPTAMKNESKAVVCQFDYKKTTISVEIVPEKHDLPEGFVTKFHCFFDDGRDLKIVYEMQDETSMLVASSGDSHIHQEQEEHDAHLTEAELVGKEVEHLGSDPIFEGSLNMAQTLMKLARKAGK